MWIYLNDAFLSIVDPAGSYAGGMRKGDELLVRARFDGDIERVFPGYEVAETPSRDYRFRAHIPRGVVADAIAGRLRRVDYSNFKGSTREGWRHDAYMGCWSVMEREQRRRAIATATGRVEPGRRIQDEFSPSPRRGRR